MHKPFLSVRNSHQISSSVSHRLQFLSHPSLSINAPKQNKHMTVFNQFHYQKNTKNQQGKNSRIVDPIKLIEWNGVYCTVDSITPMKPVGIFAEGIFLSDVILQWGFFIRGDRLIGLPLKVLPIIEIWMLKRISIAGKTSGIWWMKGTATKLTRTNLLLIGFPLKNKISAEGPSHHYHH